MLYSLAILAATFITNGVLGIDTDIGTCDGLLTCGGFFFNAIAVFFQFLNPLTLTDLFGAAGLLLFVPLLIGWGPIMFRLVAKGVEALTSWIP